MLSTLLLNAAGLEKDDGPTQVRNLLRRRLDKQKLPEIIKFMPDDADVKTAFRSAFGSNVKKANTHASLAWILRE